MTAAMTPEDAHDAPNSHLQGHVEETGSMKSAGSLSSAPVAVMMQDDEHEHRKEVSLRFHSEWGFLTRWSGSVTEYNWPKVLLYTVYVTGVALIFKVGCAAEGENKTNPESERCAYAHKKENFADVFSLWMVFMAFLFQSFVNAGLSQFRTNLSSVRSIQGRFNELNHLINSYAVLPDAEPTIKATKRLLIALAYVMFVNPQKFGGTHAEENLRHAENVLQKEEFECLSRCRPSDRPFVLMAWINRICQKGVQRGHFFDELVGYQISRALERLRGTYGGLVDDLDDAILPFPFAHLIIAQVYLTFIGLPFATVNMLGWGIIPAGAIYFWFLEGMITFVFMSDRPFTDQLGGLGCTKQRVAQPLIDLHIIIGEMVSAVPTRFPSALTQQPASITDLIGD